LPLTAMAQQSPLSVDVGASTEALNHGYAHWQSQFVRISQQHPDFSGWFAGARQTRRFNLEDQEGQFGKSWQVFPGTHLNAEVGGSSTHRVLPRHYVDLSVHQALPAGWGVEVGGRRSQYDTTSTQVWRGMVERYLGAERLSYQVFVGGPEGSGNSSSHRVQWAHYYADQHFWALSWVRGRETESLGNHTFLTSDVQGLTLNGRHGLMPQLDLLWEAGTLKQGELYSRHGVSLALRYTF